MKNKCKWFVATVMVISVAAQAAVEDKEIAECASKKGTVERLSCFDELAEQHELAPKTVATPIAGKGKWITSTSTDPLNDKSIYIATLDAESGKGRFGKSIDLVVRCANNQTEMYINWGSFLGTDGAKVTHRVGKNKASSTVWTGSTDHTSTFYPGSPVKPLKSITENDSFVANVTPYSESPITAVFDVSGAAEAFKDIRLGCAW